LPDALPPTAAAKLPEKENNAYAGQIIEQISDCPHTEHEMPLKDTYLFGYYLQRNALYTSAKTENNQEEEE